MLEIERFLLQMNRITNIDILKFICAVLVVFLHCDTPCRTYYLPLTRCAVPTFFIISGYLMYTKGNVKEKYVKVIKHISYILLYSSILYGFIKFIIEFRHGNCFVVGSADIFKFLILNENPFESHLWYLSAYLYVLIITLSLKAEKRMKILSMLCPFLLITDLLFGKYSLLLWNKEFSYLYLRNFLFVGLPYFTIGMLLKEHVLKLKKIKYLRSISILGIIIFSCTSYFEFYVLDTYSLNATRDHYLSTTFLSISLFLSFILSKNLKMKKLAEIGELDSLYIYIYHPMIMICTRFIIKYINNETFIRFYVHLYPFIIVIMTIIFSKCLRKIHLLYNKKKVKLRMNDID